MNNDVKVKLPNNLRKDIINSVNYAEMKNRVKYSTEDKIFEYLYSCENKKGQREGINRTLPRVYEGSFFTLLITSSRNVDRNLYTSLTGKSLDSKM